MQPRLPVDLVQRRRSLVVRRKVLEEVRLPRFGPERLVSEALDVGPHVRDEDVQPAELAFEVEEEVGALCRY
jgi:hypothetical protein